MREKDETVGYSMEWEVRHISMNTRFIVLIKPKHGLDIDMTYEVTKQIEKILEDTTIKIASICYRELK